MRTTILLLLGLASGLVQAHGIELQARWESAGFTKPEAVVHDAANGVLYVSNVNGDPDARDGNGSISRVSLQGEVLERHWVTGLNAPRGMAVVDGRLYVSDIDNLVEIDINTAGITARYPAPGGRHLRDVAAALDGSIYVSDTDSNTIYRFREGRLTAWLQDARLNGPSGLLVQGTYLMVAGMGARTQDRGAGLLAVSTSSRSITAITGDEPAGKLNGLAVNHDGDYLVTDPAAGRLLMIQRSGTVMGLKDLNRGPAGLAYIEAEDLLVVPMRDAGRLLAFSTLPGEAGQHH